LVDSHGAMKKDLFCFQCSKKEVSLTSELQQLRDQMNLKRSTMDEHASHLEMLREEVSWNLSLTRNFLFL